MLQWARAQHPPCPLDESVCRNAAGGRKWNVLRWLLQQEPPCPCSAETHQLAIDHFGTEAMQEWGEVVDV
jgi:hypothetical protein